MLQMPGEKSMVCPPLFSGLFVDIISFHTQILCNPVDVGVYREYIFIFMYRYILHVGFQVQSSLRGGLNEYA